MTAQRIAFTTPPAAAWVRWLWYSPVARIVLFAVMMAILGLGIHLLLPPAPKGAADMDVILHTPSRYLLGQTLPIVLAYLLLTGLIERRRPLELAPRDLPTLGLGGLIGGALLFSVIVGILWLLGSYHVVGSNPSAHWGAQVLVIGIGAGIGEEILLRGVLFRIVEEGLGTWWALAISALVFGFMHMGNPAATVWSSTAIAIEAGILFGLVYHVTRSLWACIGLHAAWNIMQGTVYGIPVSGTHADGFLVSTRTGPDWLTGGAFGAEASVVALICCSLLSIALLTVALRRGSIVAPSWQRRRTAPPTLNR